MYKTYIFPIQIFLILEKLSINLFTSKKQNLNFYNIFINNNYIVLMNHILKNELYLNNCTLIENSAIDLKYYNNIDEKFYYFFNDYKNIIFYNFTILNIKIKLFFYYFLLKNNKKNKLNSSDLFFNNANWIERETSEMYDIFFYNKKDHRKLLLEYSSFEYPLKKDFPVEGLKQIFFSFFENQIIIQRNKYIEL